MRVGIVGSRRFTDMEKVCILVAGLPEDTVVVSGGCAGVDTWAVAAAQSLGLETKEHLPDLPIQGSPYWEFVSAYHARNQRVAEDVDMLIAFVAPDRKGGTEDTIARCDALGVKVQIIDE